MLERFLLRELADEVRAKLLDAHDLVRGTNRTLAGVHTSHGKGARLDWALRDDAAAPAAVAARLLVDELRGEDGDARAARRPARADRRRAGERSDRQLRAAPARRARLPGVAPIRRQGHRHGATRARHGSLSNRLGLSQGEQRVLSYLALFAAAAAQFDAIARGTPTAPRLLLLDDAFAKVDEPTHGSLLGLLVELAARLRRDQRAAVGMLPVGARAWRSTRRSATRPQPGVALVHFRWDGRQRILVGV